MGAGFSQLFCPPGFEDGIMFTCLAKCPGQFKNIGEECVHVRKRRSFRLNQLPKIGTGRPLPSTFGNERQRVNEEATKIQTEIDVTDSLLGEKDKLEQEYSKVDSQYASFKEGTSALRELTSVKDDLRPFRPPTSPSSDLEQERRAITKDAQRNLYFLQSVLFLIVLVLLTYVILPMEYANSIAFLLLCIGIALGFFLKG